MQTSALWRIGACENPSVCSCPELVVVIAYNCVPKMTKRTKGGRTSFRSKSAYRSSMSVKVRISKTSAFISPLLASLLASSLDFTIVAAVISSVVYLAR